MASWGRAGARVRLPNWASIAVVSVGAASAQSSAMTAAGDYELVADTDCYVLVGANPTAAATTSRFLAAGQVMNVRLEVDDKVAVIRKSADGHLSILPLV